MTGQQPQQRRHSTDAELISLLAGLTPDELAVVTQGLPPEVVNNVLALTEAQVNELDLSSPIKMAKAIDRGYRERQHLQLVSDVLARAVKDVEGGTSRRIIISQPPRSGKSYLVTQAGSAWMLQRHPSWAVAITSHDSSLAAQWGRQVRRWIEQGKVPGVGLAADAGAVKEWETTAGGGVLSRSIRESFTGRGAKVLIIDDPHKDFVEAHSSDARKAVWDWWLSVAQTRLEPPSLVIVIMTRWHEDDLVGRLLSDEYEGDPADWEVVSLPAIAGDEPDALGRQPGQPLLSPLIDESDQDALVRLSEVKTSIGTYVWSALYQQQPAPAKGSIFDMSKFKFWTTDPDRAGDNVRLIDIEDLQQHGRWLDSWDFTFKGKDSSDYVVGQRWVQRGANKFLMAQKRGKWDFVDAVKQMKSWGHGEALANTADNPHGAYVHERLVEDAANGPAIMSALRDKIAGIVPVTARVSKQARAHAVSPDIEAGNVYLPLSTAPGNDWVQGLLDELRNFPHDAHDDQVDALTQALIRLRTQKSTVSNPNARQAQQQGTPPGPMSAITRRKIDRPSASQRAYRRPLR